MILSVLIPSIPERRGKLVKLTNELYRQILALQSQHPTLGSVEILQDDSIKFTEGGLSIGGKRELLKQRASGKYLCFLDDDDDVMPNYIETLVRLCNEGNHIVTFRALVKNDHYCGIIDMDLNTEVNTEMSPHGNIPRTPWHICPIISEIAKNESFDLSKNHNEDWTWMEKVLKEIYLRGNTQSHSDMILTQYNHSEANSEADRITAVPADVHHKTCLITLAIDGREKYTEKLAGLEASLHLWPYDTRIYKSYPDYCTPHSVIPYKFKFDLIQKAREDGYNRIVWLDSSLRLLKDPVALFGSEGAFMFDNLGHPLWKYISDRAQRNLELTEGQLKQIPQTWGGALGFDFTRDKACEIFAEIIRQSTMGSFEEGGSKRVGFVSHRHDQAVISAILWKHKYTLLPYGYIAAKADVNNNTHIQYGD